jgi:diguanylate cyclase (GGDEF)-like protein
MEAIKSINSGIQFVKKEIVWRFLRIDIAKKMILGYLPLTAILVMVATFSLASLDKMHRINERILSVDIKIIDKTDKMIDGILSLELFAKRFGILKTAEIKEMFFEKQKDFKLLNEELSQLPDSSYIPTSDINERFDKYMVIFTKSFKNPGMTTRVIEAKQDQIKELQKSLIDILKEVSATAREAQNERTLTTSQMSDTTLKTMQIFGIIGIILGLGAAIIITRNISGSIKMLHTATEMVSEGKFEDLPTINNQDELGDLSTAFLKMAKRLKSLEEMYIDTSPLTLLPGGIAIETVLTKRIEAGTPLSFCLVDLDNFKALNDHHGYVKGNLVIKNIASIIEEAVGKHGNESDFIGHIGGDDFVIITTPEKHSAICEMIVSEFDKAVTKFYTDEEVEKGYILGVTRQGDEARFPLVTVSIAVVTSLVHIFENHIQVGELAAELKEYAKSLEGSNFVVDRRRKSTDT